ncbi:MAG: RdgB/HAM1 family non-canonical purine NTP pyrophosphatase [Acidobacteria bacterium]|nr:RdgB/HAM1 family non-canonical purine NTP pyrophosphatase [Acidobacteriota bacterium]
MNKVAEFIELLIATRNAGKVRELRKLLEDLPLRLRDLSEWPEIAEVEEAGATFEKNAALKARGYADQTGLLALADDSGLEVAALGNAPGVLSARYAGPLASDAERITRLLVELEATGNVERRARFVCVIALARPGIEQVEIFAGTCEGHISSEPRGYGGFGYDPVFVPDGYTQTFGELSPEIKRQVSHRAHALAKARGFLSEQLPDMA